ncbi:dihydroxyacetone kinase subunit DhaL [Ornithinimicrobium cryptoxanthini]|uniref:Dihydroxyacetone kinase subunit DhaL n=1 Tax=Ornithinimicrobium cryptoxanthini TaxID=2934161 RepID=A0ABY4YEZ4_9MICO|nr:dihydroxyacetone kinase subunit DhaL [Ornithinimicrobium cryptoxanthini]USQ75096.1 dihydroxyacetone kinase subunit DhaL [Ornithinimicrobium cryptoxanthini]
MANLQSFAAWIGDYAGVVAEQADYLTDLDRAIGDADHGSNMQRGMARAARLADEEEFTAIDAYLKKVGMSLVSNVGGASGPLYGTFFLRMGGALAGVEEAGAEEVGAALRAGVEGILARGKAEVGDKTMYDAWSPALDAFDAAVGAGGDLAGALAAAAEAAAKGRDGTEDLVARKGRASYLGERSRGHIDPGATSSTMLLESAARTLA